MVAHKSPSRNPSEANNTPTAIPPQAPAAAALESADIRCWIAPRDINPGRDYAESIIDAIESGRVVVLIFWTVGFSTDGKWIASASDDKTVKICKLPRLD